MMVKLQLLKVLENLERVENGEKVENLKKAEKAEKVGNGEKDIGPPGKAIGKCFNHWGEDDYAAAWGSEFDNQ